MQTRFRRALWLLLGLGLLGLAGTGVGPLQAMRRKYDLTSEPVRGVSPQLTLATQVLGWGRGIVIDAIWIRMESLKQQDRFFELVQLADWACKLTPRIPEVWDNQAWNMAYNVSCRVDYFPDRWAWVWKGIKLLMEEGIPNNPNAFELYSSLSWILWHKIGEQDDNAHFYYKSRFARMVHEALGGSGDLELLRRLADAPATREKLLADEQVAALVQRLEPYGYDVVGDYFRHLTNPDTLPPEALQLLRHPVHAPAMQKVDAFARAGRLYRVFKLEPQRMIAVAQNYHDEDGDPAPFDWRIPYAHAIYWAELGLDRLDEVEGRLYDMVEELGREEPLKPALKNMPSSEGERLHEFERVDLKRRIYAALQSLCMHGRLQFDSRGRLLQEVSTDYRFADAAKQMYRQTSNEYGERFRHGTRRGYRNFLERGIIEFYFMGQQGKSARYYTELKEEFPEAIYYDEVGQYMSWLLRDYTSSMTYSQARRYVRGLVRQYYFYWAIGEAEKAGALEREAQAVVQNVADPDTGLRGAIRYDKIKEAVLVDIITGAIRFEPDVVQLLAGRVEERHPGLIKRIREEAAAAEGPALQEERLGEEQLRQAY